jgi:hypothetical protein
MRWLCVAAVLLAACDSDVTLEAPGAGEGGAGGAEGGTSGMGGQGFGGFGGFGDGGAAMIPWEHTCARTFVTVSDFGPTAALDDVCPGDTWAAMHYDGATAYDVSAGFAGTLGVHACSADGSLQIHLALGVSGVGEAMLTGATYVLNGFTYELAGGSAVIVEDGDVGAILAGHYEGTFGPQGGGEPFMVAGELRACHVPPLALP